MISRWQRAAAVLQPSSTTDALGVGALGVYYSREIDRYRSREQGTAVGRASARVERAVALIIASAIISLSLFPKFTVVYELVPLAKRRISLER